MLPLDVVFFLLKVIKLFTVVIIQDFGQNNQLKARKKSQGKLEGKSLKEFYGSWSPSSTTSGQFQNQLVSSVIQSSPSSILGQWNELQGPETPADSEIVQM